MQDKGGNFDLQRWKDSIPDVITFIHEQPYYTSLKDELQREERRGVEVMQVLGLMWIHGCVKSTEESEQRSLQHLGLAKVCHLLLRNLSFVLFIESIYCRLKPSARRRFSPSSRIYQGFRWQVHPQRIPRL